MPSYTFRKQERLKSRKIIGSLFKEGQSFSTYPLRIVWREIELPDPAVAVQLALTVPKRSFPKASKRVPIKRLIREAYRLNKHELYDQLAKGENEEGGNFRQYAIMVIYIAKESLPFQDIEQATKKWIRIFCRKTEQG